MQTTLCGDRNGSDGFGSRREHLFAGTTFHHFLDLPSSDLPLGFTWRNCPGICNSRSHKIKVTLVFTVGVLSLYFTGRNRADKKNGGMEKIGKALQKMCGSSLTHGQSWG